MWDIGKTYKRLVQGGVDEAADASEKARIKLTNSISFILAITSLVFGVVYYLVAGHIEFIIATSTEAVIFFTTIYLNHKGRATFAGVLLQSMITIAVVYFGIQFGKAVEVYVLAVFLCAGGLIFLNSTATRIFFLVVGILVLTGIEINKHQVVFPSLVFTEKAFIFIWYSSLAVVLMLTIFAIWHYVSTNNKLLKQLEAQKAQLEYQNDNLEIQVENRTDDLKQLAQAKSVFIRELSHELRTPLNTILFIAQYKIKPDYVENREDSLQLYAACQNTLQIINNTLDHFLLENNKKPSVTKGWIHIRNFGKDMLQAFHYIAISAGVRLELNVAPDMPKMVYEVEAYLRKIISNLLGNAIKYTTTGTAVKLSFGLVPGSDNWMIEVIDNGPGIPAEKQGEIFKEYARLNTSVEEGTGVGLANSKNYAVSLGGDIRVRSTLNIPGSITGETAFIVTLPLIKFADGPQPAAVKTYPLADVRYNGLTALVVEDNLMNRVWLKKYIEDLGFNVLEAEDGEKGWKMAQEYRPDIIITDIRMPLMGGKELLRHVRAHELMKHTPIIFCTGENGIDEAIEQDPLCKWVQKPLQFPIVHAAIQELMLTELANVK